MSSVGPCILAYGGCGYPGFPQWLGKNSSARKAKRLIRELKQKMSESVCCNQYAIQHEIIPFLLEDILGMLQSGQIKELIEFLDSLKITNEMVKEHLMGLSLDKSI
jgi:replication factor C subunit 1